MADEEKRITTESWSKGQLAVSIFSGLACVLLSIVVLVGTFSQHDTTSALKDTTSALNRRSVVIDFVGCTVTQIANFFGGVNDLLQLDRRDPVAQAQINARIDRSTTAMKGCNPKVRASKATIP